MVKKASKAKQLSKNKLFLYVIEISNKYFPIFFNIFQIFVRYFPALSMDNSIFVLHESAINFLRCRMHPCVHQIESSWLQAIVNWFDHIAALRCKFHFQTSTACTVFRCIFSSLLIRYSGSMHSLVYKSKTEGRHALVFSLPVSC